jgi:hypothetical protein
MNRKTCGVIKIIKVAEHNYYYISEHTRAGAVRSNLSSVRRWLYTERSDSRNRTPFAERFKFAAIYNGFLFDKIKYSSCHGDVI